MPMRPQSRRGSRDAQILMPAAAGLPATHHRGVLMSGSFCVRLGWVDVVDPMSRFRDPLKESFVALGVFLLVSTSLATLQD